MAALSSGCVHPGWLTDGTSVSFGNHAMGALRGAATLSLQGPGFVVPPRWAKRKRNFGTDELVRLVIRSARRVREQYPGSLLGVGDLSPRGGGATPEHGSHRSGRDVDLIYYASDHSGRPVVPDAMIAYDAEGHGVAPSSKPATHGTTTQPEGASSPLPASPPAMSTSTPKTLQGALFISPDAPRRLDVKRNWALIKALITDPEVPVQWIFISRHIKRLLLKHARRSRESAVLIERAKLVMHQPGDASPHTDHCHVRIYCAPSDRHQGCADRGPRRWLKKDLKYQDVPETGAALWGPLPRLTLSLRLPTL